MGTKVNVVLDEYRGIYGTGTAVDVVWVVFGVNTGSVSGYIQEGYRGECSPGGVSGFIQNWYGHGFSRMECQGICRTGTHLDAVVV